MTSEKIQKTARKYALQNAVKFEGSAQLKAVIGKVIAVYQKKGVHPKDIIPDILPVIFHIHWVNVRIENAPRLECPSIVLHAFRVLYLHQLFVHGINY